MASLAGEECRDIGPCLAKDLLPHEQDEVPAFDGSRQDVGWRGGDAGGDRQKLGRADDLIVGSR
ncbi:MAG: hypothetical protein FD152_4482, partial [Xanthobacteraceae bacterium]